MFLTINNLNQNTSNYSFDSNGNPSSGSPAPWTYTFDDENRLTVATLSGTSKSEFYHDARSRLRKRIEYVWSGGAWTLSTETRYVYDGMLAVQHRNGSDIPTETLTRGPDLSGTLGGAGGIGGMRARTTSYNSGTGAWTTHHYYQSDVNGNNTYLVNSSQTLAGKYTYDPYGNLISSSGLFASSNPYRFSSREIHGKSGFYFYPYRIYDPVTHRWLNRDPLEEKADRNLFRFTRNSPIGRIDIDGRKDCSAACEEAKADPNFRNDGDGNPVNGRVICSDGKPCGCVWGPSDDLTNKAFEVIRHCLEIHEDAHITSGHGFCNPCSKGLSFRRPNGDPKDNECEAQQNQFSCLQAGEAQCDGNPACVAEVREALRNTYFNMLADCRTPPPLMKF